MNKTCLIAFIVLSVFTSCGSSIPGFVVTSLSVEGLENPIGLDRLTPRLGWKLISKKRNTMQTAYQIYVSSTKDGLQNGKADIWNSGKVPSDSSQQVEYKGVPLESYRDCFWKVIVWSNHGDSVTSDINHWKMGKLLPQDWRAKWIGLDGFSKEDHPYLQHTRLASRYLRKEASISKQIKSATVYISGLGLYELYINGVKISYDVLSPTLTDYNKRVPYNTYDVTNKIQKGINCIGVILGNGRFFSMRDFHGQPNPVTGSKQVTYGFPRLLFEIRIEYQDGSDGYICSDSSWKVTDQGPIRANNEYDGEEYDSRMEFEGWSSSGFDDSSWMSAHLMDAPKGKLFSQRNENIKVKETLIPKEVYKTTHGTYIVDMGQNMVGWLNIRVKGDRGDTIKMVFSERIKSPDSLYTENLRSAYATDYYILKGAEVEHWHPKFTYHGFRYVEISGLSIPPKSGDFEGNVVYDDIQTIGNFTSSNETLNQIFKNAFWTIRGNYRGIPTDCPQRDERVAWLGDRIMSSYGESFLFDNARFYAKWMADIQASQNENGSLPDVAPAYWIVQNDNVTYPSAFIIIPEMLRKQFADNVTYRTYYPNMKKWMNYMWDKYHEGDLILKDVYGDWCIAPKEGSETIWTHVPEWTTDGGLVAATYYYYCLTLMEKFAALQGFKNDQLFFKNRANRLKIAFNDRFFHSDSVYYSNNTPTANLLPLVFGMVPKDAEDAVFKQIVKKTKEYGNHIHTGIMGAMWFMRTLSDYGKSDLAYIIATQKSYPSWGYMIENGATTIWELWNGNTGRPLMNSWNHQMLLGDLLIWYYEYLAGIKSDSEKTGFKEIIMNPVIPGNLQFLDASYKSIYGTIKSHWQKRNEGLEWDITIPPNTKAHISFPSKDQRLIKEGGVPIVQSDDIHVLGKSNNRVLVEIGSGSYHFVLATINSLN